MSLRVGLMWGILNFTGNKESAEQSLMMATNNPLWFVISDLTTDQVVRLLPVAPTRAPISRITKPVAGEGPTAASVVRISKPSAARVNRVAAPTAASVVGICVPSAASEERVSKTANSPVMAHNHRTTVLVPAILYLR